MTEATDEPDFDSFELQGDYQDGVSTLSVPAKLRVHATGCELTAPELELSIAPGELQLTDRISNTPRRISWGDAACFVTRDNDGADQLRRLLPGDTAASLPFRLENNLPLALFSLGFVALLLGATLLWGIPAGARYLAFQVPDSIRESSGQQTITLLDKIYVGPSKLSAERQQELTTLFRSVDNYPPEILFRDGGSMGANAFALPGGYVVFTDQLVKLAENDEGLLGVYLHETGHARLRHVETNALQSSAWLVVLTLMTGDIAGVSDAIFTIPVTLGQLAFARDLEREADDFAIEQMFAANANPMALADMLERLSASHESDEPEVDNSHTPPEDQTEIGTDTEDESSDWLEYMSSHPSTEKRLARIRNARPPEAAQR